MILLYVLCLIQGHKRQITTINGTQVAFSARLSANTPKLQHGQDIAFDNVILNLGNGYHNQHGAFIAPVPGVYSFSTSLLSVSSHCHAELVKNGQILAMIDFSDTITFIQAAQGVIVELDAGDDVSVKEAHYSDCIYYGSYYSTFSGFLLYQYPNPELIIGK